MAIRWRQMAWSQEVGHEPWNPDSRVVGYRGPVCDQAAVKVELKERKPVQPTTARQRFPEQLLTHIFRSKQGASNGLFSVHRRCTRSRRLGQQSVVSHRLFGRVVRSRGCTD